MFFEADLEYRNDYSKINKPFHLIIAEDDNRVSYKEVSKYCKSNKNCTLHSFPSGKHYIHLGFFELDFYKLILSLLSDRLPILSTDHDNSRFSKGKKK